MNEKEKKAIDKLQYTIEINQNILDGIEIDEQVIKSMETTLNLIDKQQKEIEELKDKNKTLEMLLQGNLFEMYNYYKELVNRYQANYISKDKIREIISKYVDIEEHLVYHHQELWGADLAEMIKELLEE